MLLASAVKWSALGKEAIVAVVGGVGVVGAFGLILLGLNGVNEARRRMASSGAVVLPVVLVVLGAAVCLTALVVGFIAMTHKPS
jgi:hypothetical protein